MSTSTLTLTPKKNETARPRICTRYRRQDIASGPVGPNFANYGRGKLFAEFNLLLLACHIPAHISVPDNVQLPGDADYEELLTQERTANQAQYRRAMRDWRKARRSWEISLVENEWYHHRNYEFFRPGMTIPTAIAPAKEDISQQTLHFSF